MPSEIMYLERVEYPRFFSLSEYAVVAEFGDIVDPLVNDRVTALGALLEASPFPGMQEIVPAYASLTVYFDPATVRQESPGTPAWERVRNILALLCQSLHPKPLGNLPCFHIPVCYDPGMGTDLHWVAAHCGLSAEEVVRMHSGIDYRVYMNGFIPGFAYLGSTHEAIEVPRRRQPVVVAEGSVAIAGRQTGIYPASITGGWQVIGRTPMVMFDPTRNPAALLRTGMRVRFSPIDTDTFLRMHADGLANH
jgi:inhibitor of KinA